MNEILTHFITEHVASTEPTAYILEGRRADRPRGILPSALRKFGGSVRATSGKQRVVFHRGKTVGGFQANLTSLTGVEAYEASRSATLANTYFRTADLPIPQGRSFNPRHYQAALEYFTQWNSEPVVVKPSSTAKGRGIALDVRSAEQFKSAWEAAAAARVPVGGVPGSNRIIIEEQIPGLSIRAFVAGENVVAATARIPLFCMGDGQHAVSELAARALHSRRRNPVLAEFNLDLEQILRDSPTAPDYVPAADEVLLLSSQVGLEYGGLTVDVTDLIHPDLQNLAIRAAWALPGCPVTAVEIVAPGLDSAEGAVLLQLDVEANLAVHQFPWVGKPRPVGDHVARAIIRRGRW